MKKFTSVILAAIMILTLSLSVLPILSSAAWDGSSASASLSGSGTEADPYRISDANDLAKLAKDVNGGESYAGKYFSMTADIDLGEKNWTPIGTGTTLAFGGVFDGGNFSIKGLVCNNTTDYGGVFGITTSGAVIKNLTVEGPVVSTFKYAAGVVGHMYVTTDADATNTVYNCHVTGGKITGSQCGGIAGRASASKAANGISIIGCTVSGTEIAGADAASEIADAAIKNTFIGGIVGAFGHGNLNGCSTDGLTLTTGGSRSTSIAVAGGIVGIQGADSGTGNIYNCVCSNSKMTVLADTPTANIGIAGIVGRAGHVQMSEVANCIALGITLEDKVNSSKAGALIGELKNYINYVNCATDSDTAIGTDQQYLDLPVKKLATLDFGLIDAADTLELNKGNSNTVWVSDPAAGHPVIEIAALENNVLSLEFYDPFAVDTTTEAATEAGATDAATEAATDAPATEAPVETTEAPATEAPATEAPATDAPATDAPAETTAAPAAKKGCGSSASALLIFVASLGMAFTACKKH